MKDKYKKIFLAIAFLGAVPALCACTTSEPEPTQLSTPQNVSVEQNTISWSAVENAEYYDVSINGIQFRVYGTQFVAEQIFVGSDIYQITIVAGSSSADFVKSSPSQSQIVDKRQTLATPQNFALDSQSQKLSWTLDSNASTYVLKVNGASVVLKSEWLEVQDQTVLLSLENVAQYLIEGANNSFCLYCAETTKFKASAETQTINFVKQKTQPAPANLSVKGGNGQVILSFDKIATATNGYTYYIDDETEGYVISTNSADISSKVYELGTYSIKVKANAVLDDFGQTVIYESTFAQTQFENAPNFVGQPVQNVAIKNNFLSFDYFDYDVTYAIVIQKTFDQQTQTVFESQVTKQDVDEGIDLSELSEVGVYDISITATAHGRKNETYTSSAGTYQFKITQKLATPTLNVENFEDTISLSISGVSNSKKIAVFVNSDEPTHFVGNAEHKNTVYLTIEKSKLIVGDNNIYCQAIGDGTVLFDSSASLVCVVKIAKIVVPQNLKITNNILTFTYDGDYEEFLIYCDDQKLGSTNTMRFELSISEVGKYKICVSAKFENEEGKKSAEITHKVTTKLLAPTNLSVANDVLTFDAVANATAYDVYLSNASNTNVVIVKDATQTTITLPTQFLLTGQNSISVVAVGDGDIYFDSSKSQPYVYEKFGSLDQATNISVAVENETYMLSFDSVAKAREYQIKITTPSEATFEVSSGTNANIDVTQYVTQLGEYQFEVTAVSANSLYSNSVATQTQNFDVLFTQQFYQSQSVFYDGKTYSLVLDSTNATELQNQLYDLVFHSVMYGKQNLQIYITQQSQDALNLANASLKSKLPCLSNLGISFASQDFTSVLANVAVQGYEKFCEVITLFERAHDQMFLYYDIDDAQTALVNSAQSTNVFNIKFTFESGFTTEAKNRIDANEQFVEKYDVEERTDFAIDNLTQTAPVQTVEQLLMVVQNDRKPEFVEPNSIAEQTYQYAKNVLSKICNNSMTDAQKAIAIYDWIMIQNKYSSETFDAASGAPFSVENLNNMDFYASGMLLYHKSVCKGYAQAFALMCNIEGIKTVETFGICGGGVDYSQINYESSGKFTNTMVYFMQNLGSMGAISAHSWNRIYIDLGSGKQWYVADATWDDPDNDSLPNAVKHQYLFANDSEIAKNRKELFPNGTLYHRTDANGNVVDYSATDSKNYFDYFGVVATNQTALNNLVASKLAVQDTLDLKFEGITQTMVESAITNAGLNVDDYAILTYYGYDSSQNYKQMYAYIYKK